MQVLQLLALFMIGTVIFPILEDFGDTYWYDTWRTIVLYDNVLVSAT